MKFSVFAGLALVAACLTACPGQVTPTTSSVTLTIAPSSSCTASGAAACTYVYSRALVPSASSSCPAATGTAYAPLNQSSPASGTTYTDSTASGDFACYIAQTEQSGLVSVASNIVGPETVPAQPTAPNLSGNVVGANNIPQVGPDQKQLDAWMKLQNDSQKSGHIQIAPPLLMANDLHATVIVSTR